MSQADVVSTSPLPPGVSETDLSRAIDGFTAALGAEKVLTSDADLREFRDPFQHATWDANTASAVVMPTTVEEIQAVLRVANEHKVPLWTHGTGRNNGYGGPAPRVRGSVIVSLRNMNRVLEINEECAYAVVEPGVRWFDLYEAIKAGDHRLMLSIADLGWGGVIGNTLDHGATYMPYGLDMGMQCGMEVVLADGTVMRTGMGAMPGNKAWHVYKRGLGPTPDQLFMQSNYGIVTKMGVWLMPYPEVYMPLWLRVWKDDDIAPVLEILRTLMLDGTVRMVPQILNTVLLGSVFSSRAQWWQEEGPIPDRVLDVMAREGAEVWGAKCAPEDIPNLEHPAERIQGGVPNLEWNAMTGWYGGEEGGHIGFSPVAPMTGRDGLALRDLLRGMVEEAGLDYMAGIIPVHARSFVHVTMVIFDTKNEPQARAAYDVTRRLVAEAAKQGYGEYRAHLDFMDLAADQYSFNDHAYRRFTETIKDALDPNGILSPGKQGIWPQGLRNGDRPG
jgi:4-cresol dehydrogenase (hydroxylating) flavoprotein subunit